MATFLMQITPIRRSAGRSAAASAAYRAGERLRDERSGKVYSHVSRRDVLHTAIFVPERFAGQQLEWASSRERLWNTAERAEKRHDARVAREFMVALPAELDPKQRIALARAFSREVTERYGVAVDLAVHAPRAGGDPRNFHAHILTTTREVTPAGLGAKAGLDMTSVNRRGRGLPDHRAEYVNIRERWAQLANSALRDAGVDARIDHRSLVAQGIDREPRPRIPQVPFWMERLGVRSEVADALRAQYRERVQRRLSRAQERDVTRPKARAADADVSGALTKPVPSADLAEVRRQAREAWLALRAGGRTGVKAELEPDASEALRQPENDLAR